MQRQTKRPDLVTVNLVLSADQSHILDVLMATFKESREDVLRRALFTLHNAFHVLALDQRQIDNCLAVARDSLPK